jgi:hypothetical protein
MNEFEVSVLEYLGKFELGILVLISINHKLKYHEATFYYDAENICLTISEELEFVVGDIKTHPEYGNLIKSILSKVVPYNQMYNRLDPLDVSKWIYGEIEEDTQEKEIIDGSEIKPDSST